LCGRQDITEYDTTPEKIYPLDEEEREKYCLQFRCVPQVVDYVMSLGKLYKLILEKKEEEDERTFHGVDKIQQTNVPALENLLRKEIEKAGYTKFEFTKTDLAKFVVVTFLLNDPRDRVANESIKQLSKLLDATLNPLNWRLITNSIEYRLGVLTGKIRAYDTDSDLLDLAKKNNKKVRNSKCIALF
jgi:hypothetical protein